MRAKEVDSFTRGGDPYAKLGVGSHNREPYVFWLPLYVSRAPGRRWWVVFPNLGLKGRLQFGHTTSKPSSSHNVTVLTDGPDDATSVGISWTHEHSRGFDTETLWSCEDYLEKNSDRLMANAQEGPKEKDADI